MRSFQDHGPPGAADGATSLRTPLSSLTQLRTTLNSLTQLPTTDSFDFRPSQALLAAPLQR
jgi:hypothetical protein